MKRLFAFFLMVLSPLVLIGAPVRAADMEKVILDDMHSFFGGYRIWLSRTGDSYIQSRLDEYPKGGRVERRYKFRLTEENIKSLEQVLAQNDFSRTDCSDHDNSTDQSVVYLYAEYGRRSIMACKYIRTNRKYPQFEAVMEAVAAIAKQHRTRSANIYNRKAQQQDSWMPPGFVKPDFSGAK